MWQELVWSEVRRRLPGLPQVCVALSRCRESEDKPAATALRGVEEGGVGGGSGPPPRPSKG